jgi:hypothetical protein
VIDGNVASALTRFFASTLAITCAVLAACRMTERNHIAAGRQEKNQRRARVGRQCDGLVAVRVEHGLDRAAHGAAFSPRSPCGASAATCTAAGGTAAPFAGSPAPRGWRRQFRRGGLLSLPARSFALACVGDTFALTFSMRRCRVAPEALVGHFICYVELARLQRVLGLGSDGGRRCRRAASARALPGSFCGTLRTYVGALSLSPSFSPAAGTSWSAPMPFLRAIGQMRASSAHRRSTRRRGSG